MTGGRIRLLVLGVAIALGGCSDSNSTFDPPRVGDDVVIKVSTRLGSEMTW